MPAVFYDLARFAGQFIRFQCLREIVLDRSHLDHPGGYILAVTHVSHLEPFLVSCQSPRRIHWLARQEFFANPLAAAALRSLGAISLNRSGVPIAALRRSLHLLESGQVVGIFPEGGVAHGPLSVLNGGPAKRGAAFLACRSQKPIIPAVVLGTHTLNRIPPWLPFKNAQTLTAYGPPILPPSFHLGPTPTQSARKARRELTQTLQSAFISLYHHLLHHTALNPTHPSIAIPPFPETPPSSHPLPIPK